MDDLKDLLHFGASMFVGVTVGVLTGMAATLLVAMLLDWWGQ